MRFEIEGLGEVKCLGFWVRDLRFKVERELWRADKAPWSSDHRIEHSLLLILFQQSWPHHQTHLDVDGRLISTEYPA